MTLCALNLGISKRALYEDYTIDEFLTIADMYAEAMGTSDKYITADEF